MLKKVYLRKKYTCRLVDEGILDVIYQINNTK